MSERMTPEQGHGRGMRGSQRRHPYAPAPIASPGFLKMQARNIAEGSLSPAARRDLIAARCGRTDGGAP